MNPSFISKTSYASSSILFLYHSVPSGMGPLLTILEEFQCPRDTFLAKVTGESDTKVFAWSSTVCHLERTRNGTRSHFQSQNEQNQKCDTEWTKLLKMPPRAGKGFEKWDLKSVGSPSH